MHMRGINPYQTLELHLIGKEVQEPIPAAFIRIGPYPKGLNFEFPNLHVPLSLFDPSSYFTRPNPASGKHLLSASPQLRIATAQTTS